MINFFAYFIFSKLDNRGKTIQKISDLPSLQNCFLFVMPSHIYFWKEIIVVRMSCILPENKLKEMFYFEMEVEILFQQSQLETPQFVSR